MSAGLSGARDPFDAPGGQPPIAESVQPARDGSGASAGAVNWAAMLRLVQDVARYVRSVQSAARAEADTAHRRADLAERQIDILARDLAVAGERLETAERRIAELSAAPGLGRNGRPDAARPATSPPSQPAGH